MKQLLPETTGAVFLYASKHLYRSFPPELSTVDNSGGKLSENQKKICFLPCGTVNSGIHAQL